MKVKGSSASKPLSLEEVQGLLVEGLKSLTTQLDAHGISYYLAFGTLLGAVRHQGIIPWDDDIDILVPREDYDRLIEHAGQIGDSGWTLMSYKTTPGYAIPWAKYCHKGTVVLPPRFNNSLTYGCSIDVFPLDVYPGETKEEAQRCKTALFKEYKQLKDSYKPISTLKTGVLASIKRALKRVRFYLVCKMRGDWAEALSAFEDHVRSMRGDAGYCGHVYLETPIVWPVEDFVRGDEQTKLTFFDSEYSVPCNWDAVLRESYGDYMTPLPESDRAAHSYIGIFWR